MQEPHTIDMNNYTANLPVFIVAIGIADAVHIYSVWISNKKEGMDNYQAVFNSMQKNFLPIFLTSLTTVLGLSTLMFFASGQSLIIQPMAISLGFGVAWSTVLNLIYGPILFAVVYRVE